MSGPDFSRLAKAMEVLPAKTEPTPLLDRLARGRDLNLCLFDQSLDSTGFVVMARVDGNIFIRESRTLRGGDTGGNKGFETDFARAWAIEEQADWALAVSATNDAEETIVVHEMPPVGNRRLPGAGASSKAAAIAVRSAAHGRGLRIVMVNSQQAKKVVCGNAKAEKKEAHDALRPLLDEILGGDLVTNEHERDAVLIGFVVLSEEK